MAQNKDSRIDSYILKSKDFARPILTHLRKLVHEACPEVEETIKWGMPHFEYKGAFCGMAAFKEHAVFGFWKGALIQDPENYLQERANNGGEAMGNLGRITCMEDLPPNEVLIGFIKQAKKLNDDGIKLPAKPKNQKSELDIPVDLKDALAKNLKAKDIFEKFSPSHRREYIEWITGAKTAETRIKRLDTTIEWLAEGKNINWKYAKKSGSV